MDDQKKILDEEALKKVTGGDITIVPKDSECPCGGSHNWYFELVCMSSYYFSWSKCGLWTDQCVW